MLVDRSWKSDVEAHDLFSSSLYRLLGGRHIRFSQLLVGCRKLVKRRESGSVAFEYEAHDSYLLLFYLL